MPDDFSDGLYLMALGMGVVILFLSLLVITTRLMSIVICLRKSVSIADRDNSLTAVPKSAQDNEELMAAISSAIHQHRKE